MKGFILLLILSINVVYTEKCTLILKDVCAQKFLHLESRLKVLFEEIVSLLHLNRIMIEGEIELIKKIISFDKLVSDCVTEVNGNYIIKMIEPVGMRNNKKVTINSKNYPYTQWHMKRINSEFLPLGNDASRLLSTRKVHVYIIDSGVDRNHPDLKDKLAPDNSSFSPFKYDSCCDLKNDPYCDCNGHGTHVAGLVASSYAGYNPNVIIHSFKVFDYSGKGDIVILQSVLDILISKIKSSSEIAIVNMSLGAPKNKSLDDVIDKLAILLNVIVVVAAGNENSDACYVSPAHMENVFTVGSSNIYDVASTFSNYGSCVNFYAPGENIVSCKVGGGYVSLSGTSMASPFAAGFISLIASNLETNKASLVKEEIYKHMIHDKLTHVNGSPNSLITDINLIGHRDRVTKLK